MDLERTTCLDFRGQMAIKSIGNGPPSKEEIIGVVGREGLMCVCETASILVCPACEIV